MDVEVLIEYLHLIIYGYSECLYCGSKRNTAEAAKQHMVDKGHCKIDISRKGSEYGDFYDLVEDAGSLGGITDAVSHEKRSVGAIGEVDSMIRLPSGKLLSSRSLTERHNRPRAVGTQSGGNFSTVRYPAALEPFGTGSGTPRVSSIEKASSRKVMNREAAWEHQLASLRVEDRRSLMHLPGWKQRAVVMEGKRLVERARRDDDKMRLKIQLKANP